MCNSLFFIFSRADIFIGPGFDLNLCSIVIHLAMCMMEHSELVDLLII